MSMVVEAPVERALPPARLRDVVERAAAEFDPAALSGSAAQSAVADWAAVEHMAAAAKARAAARVAEGSGWRASGAASAADWLARTTGTTAAQARRQLDTAGRLEHLGEAAEAARSGSLSAAQAEAIADAASADPAAERSLLDAAQRESVGELRRRCASVKAAADPDPDATYERIHRDRRLRRWSDPDGTEHLHASGPRPAMARIDAVLADLCDQRFVAARRSGRREPREAYAFDALVDLADGATDRGGDSPAGGSLGDGSRRRRTRYRVIVRADLDALVRGSVAGDETCDIAGLGPVPVSVARAVLGEAALHLVLTKGADVANVTYLGRGPNAAQRIALAWSQPTCTREGCSRVARLEVDHRIDYATTRHTRLDELDPLCGHDHDLKTRHGWALVPGTGRRPMVGPGHPDHPATRSASGPTDARPP